MVNKNIVDVQGLYDFAVEQGLKKQAQKILSDHLIKVGRNGKCVETSANASSDKAYIALRRLVDGLEESLNRNNKMILNEDLFEEVDDKYQQIRDCLSKNYKEEFIDGVINIIEHYKDKDKLTLAKELTSYGVKYSDVRTCIFSVLFPDWNKTDESLKEARDFDWKDEFWCIVKEDGKVAGMPQLSYEAAKEVSNQHKGSHIYKMSLDESLKEDLEGPATPEDNGVAKLLLQAINDESDTIQFYNDLIANTDNEDIIAIINDINEEENNHIGMLSKALAIVSPNAEAIEQGQEEAEEKIAEVSDEVVNAEPDFVPFGESLKEDLYTSEKKKIDKIVAKVQNKINKKGAYENAGQAEYREYMDTLSMDDYQTYAKLSKYFQDKLDNLKYMKESLDEELSREDKHDLIDLNQQAQEVIGEILYYCEGEQYKKIADASFAIMDAVNEILGDEDIDESLKEQFTIMKIADGVYSVGKGKPPIANGRLRIEADSAEEAKEILIKNGYKESELVFESLEEGIHDKFRRDIKNEYKSWSSAVERAEAKRKEAIDFIPDDATEEQIAKYTKFVDDMYPMPKFEYEFPHNIEKNDFPFYVTYYVEYPIYEPAEGGYYYAGADAVSSKGFASKEEAQAYADQLAAEDDYNDNWEQYSDGYISKGKYIGQDQRIVIEPSKGYLSGVSGHVPYQ